MKKSIILISVIIFSVNAFAVNQTHKLSLSAPKIIEYQCDNNTKMKVTYYNLSDNSSSFIKLNVKGQDYTLPLLVSASGERYSDMFRIQWHVGANGATLDDDITKEKSKYIICEEIKKIKNKFNLLK